MSTVSQVNLEQRIREINSLRHKLDAQQGARLPGAFARLLWVHHSTRLSGARLSLADTELLLQNNLEPPGHFPHRLVREVRGHAAAIDLLCTWVDAGIAHVNRNAVEKLHACLLGAETTPLRTQPLHTTLPGAKPFHHPAPADVSAQLDALLEWCQTYSFQEHPLLVAAEWHLGILRIQPFERGNGRLARLLQNFPLLRAGLPPLVIEFDEHEQYTLALSRAFSDDFTTFADFLARIELAAIERRLEAGEVEEPNEDDAWEKDFSALERSLSGYKPENIRPHELVYLRLKDSVLPLLERLHDRTAKLDRFFEDARRAGTLYTPGQLFDFGPETLADLVEEIADNGTLESLQELETIHRWQGRKGLDYADITASIKVRFENLDYVVYGPDMDVWLWYFIFTLGTLGNTLDNIRVDIREVMSSSSVYRNDHLTRSTLMLSNVFPNVPNVKILYVPIVVTFPAARLFHSATAPPQYVYAMPPPPFRP